MNQSNSIRIQIKGIYKTLTKTEKKIADYVLKESSTVVYESITNLANKIDVREATIVRFCKKIGADSFQKFKLLLGQDLASNTAYEENINKYNIKKDDSLNEIINKTFNINVNSLQETKLALDVNELIKAVKLIINSRKVFFCGAGVSGVTAIDAAYRLMRIGIDTISIDNNYFQRMQASLMTESDVIIGISSSGFTKDVYEMLEIAKGGGAKVICITHNINSPITKISDITLLHGASQDLRKEGALASKMSQLLILDILYNCIFLARGELENSN